MPCSSAQLAPVDRVFTRIGEREAAPAHLLLQPAPPASRGAPAGWTGRLLGGGGGALPTQVALAYCALLACPACFAAGAQDRLTQGESTFAVEMLEAAALCHHATPASLVVRARRAAAAGAVFEGAALDLCLVACRLLNSTHPPVLPPAPLPLPLHLPLHLPLLLPPS